MGSNQSNGELDLDHVLVEVAVGDGLPVCIVNVALQTIFGESYCLRRVNIKGKSRLWYASPLWDAALGIGLLNLLAA